MLDFEIRAATITDVACIADIWIEANVARTRERFEGTTADVYQFIERRMQHNDALFVIAVEAGDVAGVGHALPAREDDGEGANIIPGVMHGSMIAVYPKYWGRGIGKAITQYCIDRASELGYTSIQLWTQVSNERAQRLYGSLAFEAGREKMDEHGEKVRLYVRCLTGQS